MDADVVDGQDVRVIELPGGARLLFEAPQAVAKLDPLPRDRVVFLAEMDQLGELPLDGRIKGIRGALPKPPVNRGRSDDSRRRAYSDQVGRRGADLANEH